jgi:hypothetical protein
VATRQFRQKFRKSLRLGMSTFTPEGTTLVMTTRFFNSPQASREKTNQANRSASEDRLTETVRDSKNSWGRVSVSWMIFQSGKWPRRTKASLSSSRVCWIVNCTSTWTSMT